MLFKAQCCLIPPWQEERDWEDNFWHASAPACHTSLMSWGMSSRVRAGPETPRCGAPPTASVTSLKSPKPTCLRAKSFPTPLSMQHRGMKGSFTTSPCPPVKGEDTMSVPSYPPFCNAIICEALTFRKMSKVVFCCRQDILLWGRRYSGWGFCISTLLQGGSQLFFVA